MNDLTQSEIPPLEIPKRLASIWEAIRNTLIFIAQRLGFGALVLLFIIYLGYFGLDMASGVEFRLAAVRAATETVSYVTNLARGDLGKTSAGSLTLLPVSVAEVISERFPRSLGLLGISLLFASLLGVSLGVVAARSSNRRSLTIILVTLVGISVPSFFAAFLLQWGLTTTTRQLGRAILPAGGFGWDNHLILPVLVLAARPVAQIMRITFVAMRDVLAQDYIRTAQSKGLHQAQITLIHAFRNAAIPVLTTIGTSLRFSLSSLPIVELYFGWPGAGFTLLKGIAWQDYNLTIGLTLCLGVVLIGVNLLLELSYRLIDPRLSRKPDHISMMEKQNIWESFSENVKTAIEWFRHNPIIQKLKGKPVQVSSASQQAYKQLLDGRLTDAEKLPQKTDWLYPLRNLPFITGSLLVLGLLVVVFLGPNFAPNSPFHTQGLVSVDGKLTPPPFAPNETYPWGTDALGRCIMSLVISGAQQTLALAGLAVIARFSLGLLLGALAGWKTGSLLDRAILSLAEIISSFPALLISMILILALGIRQGMLPFIISLGVIGWGEIMQFVRGEVISIRQSLYIESAFAVGARPARIIIKHIMPNLFAALSSIVALEMGGVLMLLGELGFIGIFIGGGSLIALPSLTVHYSDVPEWGALLSDIRYQARSYPWTALYPMLAFFVSILSFNLLGEGLRRMFEEGRLLFNRLFNRYTFTVAILVLFTFNWLFSNNGAVPFYRQHASEFRGELAYQHTSLLANPSLQGRSLGTSGPDLAALYIAKMFEEYGLQPGGEGASYFQLRKRAYERLDAIPQLNLEDGGPALEYGNDYAAFPGRNMTLGEAYAPVRFVGLGEPVSRQTSGWRVPYPELERADFSNEILLTLSGLEAYMLAGVDKKGLLVVADDPTVLQRTYTLSGRSATGTDYFTGELFGEEDPYLWISEDTANRLLAGSGYTVADLRKEVGNLPHEKLLDLPLNTNVGLKVEGTLIEKFPVKNVIGLIPGTQSFDNCTDCLANRLIVVIAQYDSPPSGPDNQVYPAASDNASGIAVMLEAIRVLQDTQYEPYKSYLFVAYSGEGLDGGERVNEPDVTKFLQANPSFMNFSIEAIVRLRGVGGGSGNRLEIAAGGSLRLANLFDMAARKMGVRSVRAAEMMDIGLIYDDANKFLLGGQEAPMVTLNWEGWEDYSRTPSDTLEIISTENLESTGKALSIALMILGRETEY